MIFIRDARTAGKNPPTNPMNNENPSVQRITLRFNENPKASSENELKFVVENDTNSMNDAKTKPMTPPINDSDSASTKNADSRESKCSQCSDLHRSIGNRCVHRYHCFDHCAETKNDRNDHPKGFDENGHSFGLFKIEILFTFYLKVL